MGSKTPVSILQEMMARLGTPPKYDLIFDGSGTHTAIFKYKVYAKDVTAIGSGRSKKEAKHEAARIALEKLAQHQIADVQPPGAPPEPAVEVVTPYKDKIQENAVGALQVMCCNCDIPLPDYEIVEETGAPHEKIFTYICCVGKQKEIGSGRTKKQAKQLAAYNMMNRLKQSLSDVLQDVDSEEPETNESNFKRNSARYAAAVGTPRKKIRLNRYLYTYHDFFIDANSDTVEIGRELFMPLVLPPITDVVFEDISQDDEPVKKSIDWMEVLKQNTDAMDMQLKVFDGKPSKDNINVFLQVVNTGVAVFYGSAPDHDVAVQRAALASLHFFKKQLCEVCCLPLQNCYCNAAFKICQAVKRCFGTLPRGTISISPLTAARELYVRPKITSMILAEVASETSGKSSETGSNSLTDLEQGIAVAVTEINTANWHDD